MMEAMLDNETQNAVVQVVGTLPRLLSSMRGTRYTDGFEDARFEFEGGLQVDAYREDVHLYNEDGLNTRVSRQQDTV